MPNDNELDRIVNEALSRLSQAEPLTGLEERILQRVANKPIRHRYWVWICAAAGLSILAFSISLGLREAATPPVNIATLPLPKPARVADKPIPPKHVVVVVHTKKPTLPKLPQFPTPTGLSAGEKALVAFLKRDPELAKQAFAERAEAPDKPLEIKPIEIQPLP